MAVNFKQLSAWKSGGQFTRPTHQRFHGGLSGISCGIPGLFGNKNSALLFGGKAPTSTCTEEFNGDTSVWATSNALPISAKQAMGVGSVNAGLATGFHTHVNSTTNRSIDECSQNATNPHDSGTVSTLSADIFVEWDGTSWGSLKAAAVDSSDTFKSAGAWQAGAGTGNSAVFFGGHKSNTSVDANAWAECSKEYNGSVFTANAPLSQGRGELLGSGGQNSALAMGGTNRARYWSGGYSATDRFCAPNFNSEISVNHPTINTGNSNSVNAMMDPVATPSSNLPSVVSYSCMEEYDGTSWSANTTLLHPRAHGGAAGTQNDTVIYNGWHAVRKGVGNTPGGGKFDPVMLCSRLQTTDHWDGTAWKVDAIDIPSSYTFDTSYQGGREGARGDGDTSQSAISVDGLMTWCWECNFSAHPNSFYNEIMLSGVNYWSTVFDEGISSNNWQGPLTRQFSHSKVSGVNFGPKVPNKNLSLYYDSGNYKNYFTNEHCKPLTSDCPEVTIGKVQGLGCWNHTTNATGYCEVARDGELCGWTVGGPYTTGMCRSFGMGGGATNSALYFGGWNTNQFNNYCVDVYCYDGIAWGEHGSELLVGTCMGSSTSKNDSNAVATGAGRLSQTNQAMIDVYECADASKDQASLVCGNTNPGSRHFTQQLEGLVWTRGGDFHGGSAGTQCPQSMTGHRDAALTFQWSGGGTDNLCDPAPFCQGSNRCTGKSYEYNGSIWSTQADLNACHLYGVAVGSVNSALVIGGCNSIGVGTGNYQNFSTTGTYNAGVEEWDGNAWTQIQGMSNVGHLERDSGAGAAANADYALHWYGCKTEEWDGIAWKDSCPIVGYRAQSHQLGNGFLRGCAPAPNISTGTRSTNTSAASALAFDISTDTYNTPSYFTDDLFPNISGNHGSSGTGVTEWVKTSFRDMKSSGDRSFHMENFISASVKPSGSGADGNYDVKEVATDAVFNHRGEINIKSADRNYYIELQSGSMSTDTYFATDSTTVGSIWSHNSPLNTKREFGDAVGTPNSALFIGGITGHSTPITAVGATHCCVEEYNGLTWSTAMLGGAGNAPNYYGYLGSVLGPNITWCVGSLGGLQPAGIWQHTVTGCSADSVTLHGGACQSYSNNNIETPATAMLGVSKEFNGANWFDTDTMTNPRVGMAGAGSQNTAVVFGGGYHCARSNASMESLGCTEEYNGNTYTNGGAMVETVCQGAGAGTQNAAIGFGGCCQVGSTLTGYSDISQEYDGTSWTSNASLNNPRWKPAGAGTQNSAIAIGGYCRLNSDSTALHNCVEEYDGSAWTNRSAITTTSCDAAVGGSANAAHSFGSGTYSAKYETNTEVNRSPKIIVNNASGGVTVGMWVRFPYGDPTGGGNEFANKTYLFANADIDSSTSGTFSDRDGDTMKGRAGLRLLRWTGKLRLEWTNFVGSANEADTAFDADGNNLITSFWASNDGDLFNTTDWYHIVAMTDFSRSATANKMFINGSQIAITAGVDNKTGGGLYDYEEIIYPNNHTARISVGAWNGQVYSFDVAQVMYHDRLLEPVEIYRTYQSFKNRIK